MLGNFKQTLIARWVFMKCDKINNTKFGCHPPTLRAENIIIINWGKDWRPLDEYHLSGILFNMPIISRLLSCIGRV
jgi:hypothetical protein